MSHHKRRAERHHCQANPKPLPSMTILDLHQDYTEDEPSLFPGDRRLRYRAFAPLFFDLHEQKIVYHERFLCVVELENIELSEEGVCVTAVRGLAIDPP